MNSRKRHGGWHWSKGQSTVHTQRLWAGRKSRRVCRRHLDSLFSNILWIKSLTLLLLLSDDFLGTSSSSSQLTLTPPLDTSSTLAAPKGMTLLSPILSPSEERDATLSVSSDSVSLPTQVEVRPEPLATELAKKLTEASLEEVADKTHEEQRPGKPLLETQVDSATQQEVPLDEASLRAPLSKPEALKEEGPQDLRVFELNSDSGKSTPSNNGKKGTYHFLSLTPKLFQPQ